MLAEGLRVRRVVWEEEGKSLIKDIGRVSIRGARGPEKGTDPCVGRLKCGTSTAVNAEEGGE